MTYREIVWCLWNNVCLKHKTQRVAAYYNSWCPHCEVEKANKRAEKQMRIDAKLKAISNIKVDG